jgi:hypothetical protein
MGLGYNRYQKIDLNTVLLFVDLRLWWGKGNSQSYVYAKVGDFLRLNKHFSRGTFLEIGTGFKAAT